MLSYGDITIREAPSSDHQKTLRERAHGSLDNLTKAFRTPYPERSPKRSPGHSVAFQGIQPDMYQQKHDLPLTSVKSMTSSSNTGSTLPKSEELIPLITNQSSYIQQLEGDLKFCKEEMITLKHRTNEILKENNDLHEELKTSVVQLALDLQQFPQESDKQVKEYSRQPGNIQDVDPEQKMNKELYTKWEKELEKVKQFHDTKTKRLESQLTYTKDELKKCEALCDDLRCKLRMSESLSLLGKDDEPESRGMCIRCAQHEAVIVATHLDGKSKMLDSITKERDDLMNVVTTMKSSLAEMRQKETEAYTQVKQSLEMLEESQLEKTQALVQREQLAEDLMNCEQRMAELISEHQHKLSVERELVRKECQQQLQQLQQQIAQGVQENLSMQNQVEKVSRDKVAMATELEQAKSQIMQHSMNITQVSHDAKVTSASSTIQRDEAVRQLDKLRQTTSLEIQQLLQEKERLKSELADVKRRMDDAEKQALLSKDESIKLTERCNTAERDLMLVKMAKDGVDRSRNDDLRSLTRRTQQREQELQQIIHELQNKYSCSVTELENVICSQGLLINKLRDEGTNLTEKLQEVSDKYRSEIRRLKQVNSELTLRCDRLSQQHAEIEAQCVDHGRLHKRMKLRLEQMDEHSQRSGKQIYELLQKQAGLMQERHALSQEVDFLRSQDHKYSPTSIPSISTRGNKAGSSRSENSSLSMVDGS
ncbi:serologically defined colon cancer antigen 8 homolog isoform X2 [Anneissia japonica]|uniref:serologically defined colon cancer antigen 8 homolog isoform X2 n=1 Tax=Anneissia japonica TaxID=1529436 RepID=UPI00142562A0|nr:serologically defined colon cancer antigen 8 homolog isoform X2 [Anneissia japonica]